MRKLMIGTIALVVALSACGRDTAPPVDLVAVRPIYDVQSVSVLVPRDLTVSDANLLYPVADIVWTEEAPGDRHTQVAAILTDALTEATSRTNSDAAAARRDAVVQLELHRFHALSRMARELTGGVHNIVFTLHVTDPSTGQPITEPKRVETSLRALGGARAAAARARGETERNRIVLHLANLLRGELSEKRPVPPAQP